MKLQLIVSDHYYVTNTMNYALIYKSFYMLLKLISIEDFWDIIQSAKSINTNVDCDKNACFQ